jgi:hypothetical protein
MCKCEEIRPMPGLGIKGTLTILVGMGGNGPYGPVQHRHGTGLAGHLCLCERLFQSKAFFSSVFNMFSHCYK